MDKDIVLSNLKHKTLKKKVLESGDFSINPVEGSECNIVISDVCIKKENYSYHGDDDSLLLSKDFSGKWIIGDAASYIDIDIERCIQHMFLSETSLITITYLDKNESENLNISLKIKIENIINVDLFCDWHWAKKVNYAKQQKNVGKDFVKNNRIIEAFRKFSKALKVVLTLDKDDLEGVHETDVTEIKDLKVDLYNNLAFCQLQYSEHQAVIDLCNKALQINKTSEKALYRRGCALMGLSDWEAAYSDICQVLSLNPNNAAAKCKATKLREKVIHLNEAYKKVIKNMFV